MGRKGGLGKGLGAIFGENRSTIPAQPVAKEAAVTAYENKPQDAAIETITANPYQPRRIFDEEKLQELAASIKEFGIVQPLVVRKKGEAFELVAGERRLRAAKLAGLANVPVVIKDYDDTKMMEIALIENIQRHDLNPIEEAQGLRRLMSEFKLTQEQVAEKVGRSRVAVTNFLRLYNLPQVIQNDIINGINQSYDFDKSNKNINAGNTINSRTYSSEFLSKCETLKDYMTFVNKVRIKTDIEKIDIRTAVTEAVDECIAENVLSEFFRNHREEVITVSIYEYDEEGHLEVVKKKDDS